MPLDKFTIAVLPGDGIGIEVIAAGIAVLDAAARRAGGLHLDYQHLELARARTGARASRCPHRV